VIQMRVLAFDTSSDEGGIALLDKGEKIFHIRLADTNRIAENIYSLLKRVLLETNLSISDIDLFSAVLGPGSFTGLRVSLAAIKAFALALEKPVYGIETMKLMVFSALKIRNFERAFVMQNARREEVFLSLFDNELNEIEPVRIVPVSALFNLFKKDSLPVVVREDESVRLLPDDIDCVKIEKDLSVVCAELSQMLFLKGYNITSPSDIEPVYIRNDVVRQKRPEKA
ncbi:MAG: tRNA (adenosine(37)-N6)-threonylcarbamoyltransferase complex dimerization subunit type 1 TsaB, partial [Deltaproteobacteria bacterium]|nr:tRNA (adenosine(37)-N6)-threonylcarbamoyltransferase complex dimerization subunit type 1 TsaB [Deltaproteobacteria bacterium]